LKTEQQCLKALQQSIVQLPRDANPLMDARFHRDVELLRQLAQTELTE
jgi:hypothetical protein